MRLTKIDELTLSDHYYLSGEDECYYVGEYTARKGYSFSETNHLIINLKKPVDRRGTPQYKYKGEAITKAAQSLIGAIPKGFLESAIVVPVPPSKTKDHPLYDDRLQKILNIVAKNQKVEIREIVTQSSDMEAAHDKDDRPKPENLVANYVLNDEKIVNPNTIIVFDDLLTTGCHFVAMKSVLKKHFPNSRVIGIFLARRAPDTSLDIFFPP